MKKRNSIIISIRMPKKDIIKGIQVFLANGKTPTKLSEIIKTLYNTGIQSTFNKNIVSDDIANEILSTLTTQTQVSSSFTISPTTKKEEKPQLDYGNLLENLADEEKSAGYMILSNLQITKNISANLKSDNDKIASLTAKLFYPIRNTLGKEAELIKKTYVKFYKEGV